MELCNCGNNIFLAINKRHKDCLRRICEKFPECMHGRKGYLSTPLFSCIKKQWMEGIQILLEEEKKIGEPSKSTHALQYMAYHGMHTLLALFLQSGYDVNQKDNNFGNTPLHAALEGYNSSTIKGIDEDMSKVIYLLMDYGADHSIRNNYNELPTDLIEKDLDIIKYIQNYEILQIKEPFT